MGAHRKAIKQFSFFFPLRPTDQRINKNSRQIGQTPNFVDLNDSGKWMAVQCGCKARNTKEGRGRSMMGAGHLGRWCVQFKMADH